jgi:hypothetical protein
LVSKVHTQLETQNPNKVKTQIVGKNKRTPKNTLGRKKKKEQAHKLLKPKHIPPP